MQVRPNGNSKGLREFSKAKLVEYLIQFLGQLRNPQAMRETMIYLEPVAEVMIFIKSTIAADTMTEN